MLVLRLELRLAALAAEVDRLAVVLERRRARDARRPSSRRSGRSRAAPAARRPRRPRRQSASGGAAVARRGARRRSCARIESAISAGVRAPMSMPAGTSIRASCSLGHAVAAQLGEHARAALRAGDEADVRAGPPRGRGAACAARRARAPRRRARGRRAGGSRPSSVTRDDVEPELGADAAGPPPRSASRRPRARAARAARARGTPRSRLPTGTGSARSTAPSSAATGHRAALAVLGERQDAQQHGLAALERLQRVRAHAVLRHMPPTKPSIVPSASTSATFPASTLVGRCTCTTVAVTNAAPSAASCWRAATWRP